MKKKKYNKKVKDAYWEGVKAGMNVALDNPMLAEYYRDKIPQLRVTVEKTRKAVKKAAKTLAKCLQVKED